MLEFLKGGNKKLLYVLVIALIICVGFAFWMGRNYPMAKAIDKIVQDRVQGITAEKDNKIKELENRLRVTNEELKNSKLKYQRIRTKIEEAARKEDEIKVPTTNDEIKNRLDSMGYRTK
jgi:cell division protein FtsB